MYFALKKERKKNLFTEWPSSVYISACVYICVYLCMYVCMYAHARSCLCVFLVIMQRPS